MKIAFIHPDLGIGGAERLVLDVAVALSQKGVDVLFLTNHFDNTHAFEELKNGQFPVHVIGDWIPRSFCGKFQAVFAYIRMFYLALTYMLFMYQYDRPDIFFVDQIPMANLILKFYKTKVIYYCHHPDLLASPRDSLLKKIYRAPIDYIEEYGTKLSDVILVNSKYTASIFYKTFPTIKKKIYVLYPTIASSYLDILECTTRKLVSELVPEIRYNKNDVVFLSINRFHPAKKLELAINAMESLKSLLSYDDWLKVYLIIAGGYDPQSTINRMYFDKLVALVADKQLESKIIFLKSPSDVLKAELLMACDCLVYTPINEHFGIVPLEAMAAGKPVIACNSGGPCETIAHEVTGFLAEPEPSCFAECMKLTMNLENSRQMGVNGKKKLEHEYSYRAFSQKAVDIACRTYDDDFEEDDFHDISGFSEAINPGLESSTDDNETSPTSDISLPTEKEMKDVSITKSDSSFEMIPEGNLTSTSSVTENLSDFTPGVKDIDISKEEI